MAAKFKNSKKIYDLNLNMKFEEYIRRLALIRDIIRDEREQNERVDKIMEKVIEMYELEQRYLYNDAKKEAEFATEIFYYVLDHY